MISVLIFHTSVTSIMYLGPMSGYFGLIAANIVKQILAHVTMDTGQHKSGVDGWDYTDRDNCS